MSWYAHGTFEPGGTLQTIEETIPPGPGHGEAILQLVDGIATVRHLCTGGLVGEGKVQWTLSGHSRPGHLPVVSKTTQLPTRDNFSLTITRTE